MNTLLYRRQPWALHNQLFNEMSRYFDRTADQAPTAAATSDWVPPVDIEEHADRFVIHAEVPGVDPASIEVTLEKGVLTLSGTRAKAVAKEGVESRRTERVHGRFQRRFTLPETANTEEVSATGQFGVLEVTIPKRAAVQPRRINVKH